MNRHNNESGRDTELDHEPAPEVLAAQAALKAHAALKARAAAADTVLPRPSAADASLPRPGAAEAALPRPPAADASLPRSGAPPDARLQLAARPPVTSPQPVASPPAAALQSTARPPAAHESGAHRAEAAPTVQAALVSPAATTVQATLAPPREGTMLLHTAPTWRRAAAALLDLIVPLALWGVGTWLLVSTDPEPPPVAPWNFIDQVVDYLHDRPGRALASAALAVALLVIWPLVFLGRTPGRRLLRLGVSAGDRPVRLGRLLAWACARVLLTLPAGFGALWAIVDVERRTLYDRLAGVWVVHHPRPDDEIRR